MFDLTGKKALITGASGAIGAQIARTLCERGAHAIVTGTNAERLQSLVDELSENCTLISGDMSDIDFVEGLLLDPRVNNLDILVCNAGVTRDNLLIKMSDNDWRQVMTINLDAVFRLNRAAVKIMLRKRYGRIINISSITGLTGNVGQVNYTASKAAIIGMSKSIAREVAARNITVNCIAPGFIDSAMTSVLSPEIKEELVRTISMKRMGNPKDIASACLFLASSEASYITGETLHVNGGMYMS